MAEHPKTGARRKGPVERELDELWGGYSSPWKRLLSRGALTELQLRASFDLDLLAPSRIANKVAAGTIPDCDSCDDICCAGVENIVSLRLVDIATLIDIERTDLIRKKKPRFPAAMLRTRPMLRELVASELFRALPVLAQVGERRICAALTPSLRCSLYPHWPLSCERFPYTLSAIRREVVWGIRCPSQRTSPSHEPRREELFGAAVDTFNERVRDAVLIAHAPDQLEAMGISQFLTRPGEDPFEDKDDNPLPVIS